MKKLFYLIFTLFLVCMNSTAAYAIDCKLLVTPDTAYADKWYNVPVRAIPALATTDKVFKKQYFTILPVLNNYQVDSNSITKIYYDIEIFDKDKKVYFDAKNLNATNFEVPQPNVLLLSKNYIKMCFEPEDKLGIYTIKVTVRDLVSGKSTVAAETVALVDFEYEKYFENDDSLNEWMNSYYINPTPEKAIDAYLYYLQSRLSDKKNAFLPVFSFFLKVFSDNKYLIPYLTKTYDSQNPKTKHYILYLLRYLDYDTKEFIENLKGNELKAYQKLLAEKLPDPYGEITIPGQIDMLWGEFLASGEYRPIKRVVDLLELCKYNGYIEKFPQSAKIDADKKKAILDAIYQAVKWSLTSNYDQHNLVKGYCDFIYEQETINETVKKELKQIIE